LPIGLALGSLAIIPGKEFKISRLETIVLITVVVLGELVIKIED